MKIFLIAQILEQGDPAYQGDDLQPFVEETLKRKIYFTRESADDAARAFKNSNPSNPSIDEFIDFTVKEVELPFELFKQNRCAMGSEDEFIQEKS